MSLGPFEAVTGGEMVSRRRILSRSRDDLTQAFAAQMEEEEDVWYQKDKLYKLPILDKRVNSDPLIEIVTDTTMAFYSTEPTESIKLHCLTLLTTQCQDLVNNFLVSYTISVLIN
ncbi:unnamed protein product [Euphydryas editha]|uniref:Uncharacterized protein n=1 Tax=Euphydryas editha TaxID=104508 RepID=A0AAU9UZD3_EUPED|nr:unnamed protein product [Euphydryas editha]